MTASNRLLFGAFALALSMVLAGCGQSVATAPDSLDTRAEFGRLQALDKNREPLDCAQLVAKLTPVQSGQVFDYVVREEEANHYQFQQCRQAIQKQADAVCDEAADTVMRPSASPFPGGYEGVAALDKACIQKVRTRVKDGQIQYRIVKGREPFLVVYGAEVGYYSLQKLVRLTTRRSVPYDGIETYVVQVHFGEEPQRGIISQDINTAFTDKEAADAFVTVLTGQGPAVAESPWK